MRDPVRLLFAVALLSWAPPAPSVITADAAEKPASADTAKTTRYKPATPSTPAPPSAKRAPERSNLPFPAPYDTSALSVLRWRTLNLPRSGRTTVAPLPPPGANAAPDANRGTRLLVGDSLLQRRLDAHALDCDEDFPELPEAVTRVPPVLPPGIPATEARRIVRVFMVVDEEGVPRALRTPGPPSALDSAAVACVSQWRFRPAKHCGHAYPVWVAAPVRFDLR